MPNTAVLDVGHRNFTAAGVHLIPHSLVGLAVGQLSPPRQEAVGGGMNNPEQRVVRCRRGVQLSDMPAKTKKETKKKNKKTNKTTTREADCLFVGSLS